MEDSSEALDSSRLLFDFRVALPGGLPFVALAVGFLPGLAGGVCLRDSGGGGTGSCPRELRPEGPGGGSSKELGLGPLVGFDIFKGKCVGRGE